MLIGSETKKIKVIEAVYTCGLGYKKGLLHIDTVAIEFDDTLLPGGEPKIWVTLLFPCSYHTDGNASVQVQVSKFDDLIRAFNEEALKFGFGKPIKTFKKDTWKFLGDVLGRLVHHIRTNKDISSCYRDSFAITALHTIQEIANKMSFYDYREFMSAFNAAL